MLKKQLLVVVLVVCLALGCPSVVLAHGHWGHHGGYHGPIIVGGPVLIPFPYPYPVPTPTCVSIPGRWVWNGMEWVWMPGQMVCS